MCVETFDDVYILTFGKLGRASSNRKLLGHPSTAWQLRLDDLNTLRLRDPVQKPSTSPY